MLIHGILNPHIHSLLGRVRHTNTLVIADRGFPYWPAVETIDISLTDDIPRVLDVLTAIRANFSIGAVFMADEFRSANPSPGQSDLMLALSSLPVAYEPHTQLKLRVPAAIGILRTADTTPYSNLILESA